jgi:AcrR family transcriptional regulator
MAKGTAAAGLDDAQAAGLEAAWDEIGPPSARRLLIAAVDAFAARGYHGTSTRDIADRAGLSPAGVYVHFASKEDLFYRITLIGHQQTLRNARVALESLDPSAGPADRLHAVIEAQTTWQARHHTTARVVEYDLPALSPEHYQEVSTLRRRIAAVVRGVLADGARAGVFDVPDVDGTTLALLSMVTDVARWYPSNSRQSPERLGRLYADLALRMAAPHGAGGGAAGTGTAGTGAAGTGAGG